MKILFVISCNGGGNGGHNHSLNHISKAISEKHDVRIVSVGLTEVNVLKGNALYLGKLPFKWWNIFSLNSKFKKIFTSFNPDIIHCFDGSSALILMAQPSLFYKRVIYTKCGGPNERDYIAQVASDIILFSQENFDSYHKNPRFKNSNLYLIPNRVFDLNFLDENKRKFQKDIKLFNFVRICRIGSSYEQSIIQSINLIAEIQKNTLNKPIKLYLIGKIVDQEIFYSITQYAQLNSVNLTTITDDSTNEASKLLYLADAVIGTGRGVMEALSLGLPTFVPQKSESIPTLLKNENILELLHFNFSPRSSYSKFNFEKEVELSIKLVLEKDFYQHISDVSKKLAEENFVVTPKVVSKYESVYHSALNKPNKIWVLKNIFPLIYYINSFRRAQKAI
ncbi:MAG: hypothetical protein ACK4JX_06495 [Flavobacterium sp.]